MNEVEYPSGLRREPAKLLFVGSNPTSTSQSGNHLVHGSIAQLAEQRPLKANVAGSIPATPTYSRIKASVVRSKNCSSSGFEVEKVYLINLQTAVYGMGV